MIGNFHLLAGALVISFLDLLVFLRCSKIRVFLQGNLNLIAIELYRLHLLILNQLPELGIGDFLAGRTSGGVVHVAGHKQRNQ